MVVTNGIRRWCSAAALACLGNVFPGLCTLRADAPMAWQTQDPADELERLRALLGLPGPDGREARERAIERLLSSARPDAHALLVARLRARDDDADGVLPVILASLQRHLLLQPTGQFGGASGRVRERLLADYLRVLAPAWRDLRQGSVADDPFREAARIALQRVPPRELDAAARSVLSVAVADEQLDVMRCLADMQQTLFAATIAERLEVADARVRAGAQEALQLLTCHEHVIQTKAQFAAWQAANGELRYIDLVERAARRGAVPIERLQAEIARLRIDAAREVVRAHVTRSPGVDWAAVHSRVVVDDAAVLDACLELLQQALPGLGDDASPARAAFARALLQRFHQEAKDTVARKARLLEVAAYLGRAEDGEFAKDLTAALMAQLDVADTESRLAALRGLRRYPSPESRARLVVLAERLLGELPAAREQLASILSLLGSRTPPRWLAPSASDTDKAAWLTLVAHACRSDESCELRELAAALAPTLDAREQRVSEAFDLLLELVRDSSLSAKFRCTCAIHLQQWRNDAAVAWLRVQHELLRDQATELRLLAAESLASLPESVDSRRNEWVSATIVVLRERLLAEPDAQVLRALVDCVQNCGREASMSEKAVGALRFALSGLGDPVAPEHQFRLDPLLQALATIGADARADRGQWLAVCEALLPHRRRQSLRLILVNHAAIDLAKDVVSTDPSSAEYAHKAMTSIIETGVLKPPRESWSASEELLREARDVRAAFAALDEKDRPDDTVHRLLRLEVELASGKPQEVVQRATAWLANGEGGAHGPMTGAERNRMRLLAAEAHLALGRPDAARRLLDERTGDVADDAAARDLELRIARALVATDLAGAVELCGRVWRRTSPEEPFFRARLLEWMQLRIRLDPGLREDTLREGAKYAAHFEAKDCPAELREVFEQLRTSR